MLHDPTYFVYIIKCRATGEWCIGTTEDPLGVLESYNGQRMDYEDAFWCYIFVRPMDDQQKAIEFERHLKANQDKPDVLKKYSMYFRFGMYPGERPVNAKHTLLRMDRSLN